jgi:hypothetical protein
VKRLRVCALGAVIVAAAGCGHVVTAASQSEAMARGAAACHQLHAWFEGGAPSVSGVGGVGGYGSRTARIGAMVRTVEAGSGYSRKQDLRNAFLAVNAQRGPRDLGPLDWR